MKVLVLGNEAISMQLKQAGYRVTIDPQEDVGVVLCEAVNSSLAPGNTLLYILSSGGLNDWNAKKNRPDAIFVSSIDEFIEKIKDIPTSDDFIPEPVAGDSFLGISYSNKGGVGKTTSAISLAFCLSEMGYKTVLADFDFRGPNLATFFNVKKPFNYLSDVNETSIRKSLAKVNNNLYSLVIKGDISPAHVKDGDLLYVVKYLREHFQCVIIDTMVAPHEYKYMWEIFRQANLIYAITEQAKTTMEETGMYAPALLLMGVKPYNIRILVNQYTPKQASLKEVERAFNQHLKAKHSSGLPKIAGVFPSNRDAQLKALREGTYLNKEEWRKVCAEIPKFLNIQVKNEETHSKKGFFEKLKNLKNKGAV